MKNKIFDAGQPQGERKMNIIAVEFHAWRLA
jgi:hypothetical protein